MVRPRIDDRLRRHAAGKSRSDGRRSAAPRAPPPVSALEHINAMFVTTGYQRCSTLRHADVMLPEALLASLTRRRSAAIACEQAQRQVGR